MVWVILVVLSSLSMCQELLWGVVGTVQWTTAHQERVLTATEVRVMARCTATPVIRTPLSRTTLVPVETSLSSGPDLVKNVDIEVIPCLCTSAAKVAEKCLILAWIIKSLMIRACCF